MMQDIIALTIVFSTLGYMVYSLINNIQTGNNDKCNGCKGCDFKGNVLTRKNKST